MSRLTAYTSVRIVESWPEDIGNGELVVRQHEGRIRGLHFLCPDNCGDAHMLPAHHTERDMPGWQIAINPDSTVTVSPSILRRGGCQSHFFIERNAVRWC